MVAEVREADATRRAYGTRPRAGSHAPSAMLSHPAVRRRPLHSAPCVLFSLLRHLVVTLPLFAPEMIRTALYHAPLVRSLVTPALRLAHTTALRHPSLSLLRFTPSSSPTRDALHTRHFSSSPQRRAEEDPERNAQLQNVFTQQQKLLKLLQEKPETLEHIKKFVEQLESNGACFARLCAIVARR